MDGLWLEQSCFNMDENHPWVFYWSATVSHGRFFDVQLVTPASPIGTSGSTVGYPPDTHGWPFDIVLFILDSPVLYWKLFIQKIVRFFFAPIFFVYTKTKLFRFFCMGRFCVYTENRSIFLYIQNMSNFLFGPILYIYTENQSNFLFRQIFFIQKFDLIFLYI